jgi:hypothetical protein
LRFSYLNKMHRPNLSNLTSRNRTLLGKVLDRYERLEKPGQSSDRGGLQSSTGFWSGAQLQQCPPSWLQHQVRPSLAKERNCRLLPSGTKARNRKSVSLNVLIFPFSAWHIEGSINCIDMSREIVHWTCSGFILIFLHVGLF